MKTEALDIKGEWVHRLRSGNYLQGRLFLQKGEEFCCLGVLCDMAETAGVVATSQEGALTYYSAPRGVKHHQALPVEVAKWAGFEFFSAEYGSAVFRVMVPKDFTAQSGREILAGFHDLAADNDDGFSFEDIAEIIECGL